MSIAKDIRKAGKAKPKMDLKRALSWSAISSFQYSKEQWYSKYVLGEQEPPSPEMLFGSKVGNALATDPTFLPDVPRYPVFEHELRTAFSGIPLVGFIDSFDQAKPAMYEYKTGKKPWDQTRTDTHGQIDMYLLMLYLTLNIRPEEMACAVIWLPTAAIASKGILKNRKDFLIDFRDGVEVKPVIIPTKRSMKQITEFGNIIKATYLEMKEYAANH